MNRLLFAALVVLLLAACGGAGATLESSTAEPTAVPATNAPPTSTPLPTSEPAPEPTATAVPDLDLAAAIAAIPLPGHLSATISSDEELLKYWRGSEAVSLGNDFYNLVFNNDETGNPGGEVAVYIYDSPEVAAENFELVRAYFDTLIQPDDYDFVGNAGVSASSPPFEHRAFTLCTALVYVRMSGASFDQIDAYAQGVERAIETAVCGPE